VGWKKMVEEKWGSEQQFIFVQRCDGGLTPQQLKMVLAQSLVHSRESQFFDRGSTVKVEKGPCHLWLPFLLLKRDENAWTVLLVSNAPAAVTSGASSAMVIGDWLASWDWAVMRLRLFRDEVVGCCWVDTFFSWADHFARMASSDGLSKLW
jgi:hypothetical protein